MFYGSFALFLFAFRLLCLIFEFEKLNSIQIKSFHEHWRRKFIRWLTRKGSYPERNSAHCWTCQATWRIQNWKKFLHLVQRRIGSSSLEQKMESYIQWILKRFVRNRQVWISFFLPPNLIFFLFISSFHPTWCLYTQPTSITKTEAESVKPGKNHFVRIFLPIQISSSCSMIFFSFRNWRISKKVFQSASRRYTNNDWYLAKWTVHC